MKSTPSTCEYPLASSQVLNFSSQPTAFFFLLHILEYLDVMPLHTFQKKEDKRSTYFGEVYLHRVQG